MTSIPHDSSYTHVTGKSEYVDDRAPLLGELFVGVVYSTEAHAKILHLDFSKALKIKGVRAVFTASDFDQPYWGTVFQDQPLLAGDTVRFYGEPIALLACETLESLRDAQPLVSVKYRKLPVIRTITEAIEKESFIGDARIIQRGEVVSALESAPHRLAGKIQLQGADHFYLENQMALAYPLDSGGIEVHSSSQHPTEVQHVVSHALGLPYHQVTCIVKRMGGAFGGKESQGAPFAAYVALVAQRLKCSARLAITKDEDMIITGKRNPFEISYSVGFDDSGKIIALDAQLHSDAGAYADLSIAIMERAMLHCDNAYFIPHVRIKGQVCKTNFHSHTAFRGFGGPKGVAMIEKVIEEIAEYLKKDSLDVRVSNIYRPGYELTPYGQKVENNLLPDLFQRLEKSCDYRKRRTEISNWNSSKPTLRGLSLTPVKFGISFTTRFLNQGNALVIVHRDGSVQVSTGGTEMGQGMNTRIAQLVAEVFGISPMSVRLMPTATDKNGNTSPTAASSGTDLNGAAAAKAALKIRERLNAMAKRMTELEKNRWARNTAGLGTESEFEGETSPERDYLGQFNFVDVVNEAYLNRLSLSEYAHYKIPNLTFNKAKGQGDAFLYFTQGVAASEVSVDPISGEVKVLRVDILMDLGRPINRALDLGQITGAFVQGMGWVTTENLCYSKEGALLSHSPSTYKIPSIQDTPRVFNVELMENLENKVNIRGTKAAGEPPLLLAISVWTAIRDALSYRAKNPELIIPATSERILNVLDRFL